MWKVLLDSLLWIVLLAALAFVLVKYRGGTLSHLFPRLPSGQGVGRARSHGFGQGIVIRQRKVIGWKSTLLDVQWHDRSYLLVVQEGKCTVVDVRRDGQAGEANADV